MRLKGAAGRQLQEELGKTDQAKCRVQQAGSTGAVSGRNSFPVRAKPVTPFTHVPHSMSQSPLEIAFLLVFLSCLINASAPLSVINTDPAEI